MSSKKIFIVAEGGYGAVTERDYQKLAEILKIYLEGKDAEKKSLSIEILKKAEEADNCLKQNDAKAIIYLSCGQATNAKKIQLEHPGLVVIIYTGLPPQATSSIHVIEKAGEESLTAIAALVIG